MVYISVYEIQALPHSDYGLRPQDWRASHGRPRLQEVKGTLRPPRLEA